MTEIPACKTCLDRGTILHLYARGPGDPPGNFEKPCPTCSVSPPDVTDQEIIIEVLNAQNAIEDTSFSYHGMSDSYEWRRKYVALAKVTVALSARCHSLSQPVIAVDDDELNRIARSHLGL